LHSFAPIHPTEAINITAFATGVLHQELHASLLKFGAVVVEALAPAAANRVNQADLVPMLRKQSLVQQQAVSAGVATVFR
jgi:hypothetical protein